jgi:hypothetical protein
MRAPAVLPLDDVLVGEARLAVAPHAAVTGERTTASSRLMPHGLIERRACYPRDCPCLPSHPNPSSPATSADFSDLPGDA